MQHDQLVRFGPYQLDLANAQLQRSHQVLPLTNKAFEVLCYLVGHAGQLVTKERLFQAVWADTVVTETVLTNCISELRQVLRDNSKKPHFIETVHRRGYRFIEKVVSSQHSVVSRQGEVVSSQYPVVSIPTLPTQSSALSPQHSVLVGRESELVQLHSLFVKALNSERQVVFVTGEAGIGKTTLIDAFVQSLVSHYVQSPKSKVQSQAFQTLDPRHQTLDTGAWVAWGQCIEHYGAGEAYLPVLEALGRLGRQPSGERLLAILSQYAPTWVAQLPALLNPADLEAVQRRVQGVTRERMLREIAEALDIVTAEQPLVLVLEDLHWSDPSTVELLATLARRREAARLLVLGTYRAAELVVTNHPLKMLKQELVARGQGVEISLSPLSRAAVRAYVAQRLLDRDEDDALVDFVYRRTDGQPLFMVQITDYLAQHDRLTAQSAANLTTVEQTLPHGLRELIEAQLGRLTEDEQKVLTLGSVSGVEFTVANTAAGLGKEEIAIEEICDRLTRRGQFIEEREVKTWPDGTVSGSYGFRHALYQEVLYTRIPEARRVRLHRGIGERIEGGYGERGSEVAAELAVHFERGRDYQRAVRYRQHASEQALRRNAYQEAAMHCTAGLSLLALLPETPERLHHELNLQMAAGVIFAATKGYAAPEVEQAYLRAQSLCEQHGDTQQQIQVLRGLMILYTVRANFPVAREVGERLLTFAQEVNDVSLLQLAHMLVGVVWLWLGELSVASDHFSRGVSFVDPPQTPEQRRSQAIRNGQDHRVALLAHAAWMLWLLGYPAQAVQQSEEALRVARAIAHPFSEAFALLYGGGVRQFCRAVPSAQDHAAAALQVAEEQGFTFFAARAKSVEGWICAQQKRVDEGIVHMQQSLAVYERLGIERGLPHFFADLAEAFAKSGQYEEGEATITRALQLVANTGERWYEAELWRLKGEFLLVQESREYEAWSKQQKTKSQGQRVRGKEQQSETTDYRSLTSDAQGEAETCFLKAIAIAREQQAKSLELRAVMSLVRLRQHQAVEHGAWSAEHGEKSKELGVRSQGQEGESRELGARSREHATRTTQHGSRTTQPEIRAKLDEAHQMLSEVYLWFTEGFDTKDLQEAKTLLEDLG